jgi:transcriptional regulator with XRE-family HTH domain
MLGTMTDDEVVREIGRRLRAYRLQQNLGIVDVAARAGVNRNTVLAAEGGGNPRLETVVRLLRALGRLEAMDAFLAPPGLSPLALVRSAGKPRQRARRKARG